MASYETLWDMTLDAIPQDSHDEKEPTGRINHTLGNIIYGVVGAAFKVAFRYRAEGVENVRAFHHKQGAIVVCNHTSYLDPVMLWLCLRPTQWVRLMARDNMFKNFHGIAGHVLGRVGAFPIKRDSADRTAIKRATAMLKRGELVGIYPEGTRRGRGTAEISLHSGVAFIARMAKAPMIPATVRDVEKVKPKGQKLVHFPQVTVEYGRPVYLDAFDFLPKEDRLDGATWYVMRECYALSRRCDRDSVDMTELFPDSKDFSCEFKGKDLFRSEI